MSRDNVRIIYHYKIESLSRAAAKSKYLEGMMCCEGAERERDAAIYAKLAMGASVIDADDY